MSNKASIFKRLKNMANIIFPLIFFQYGPNRCGKQCHGTERVRKKEKKDMVHGETVGTK